MKSGNFGLTIPKLLKASKAANLPLAIIGISLASCSLIRLPNDSLKPQVSQVSQALKQTNLTQSGHWQLMNEEEQKQAWTYVLNSPLGIAALNQLAIEGFISPNCPKTFYLNNQYGAFQTLLQVQCPTARGVSTALNYNEIRIIFNRFEDNIEDFKVERMPFKQ